MAWTAPSTWVATAVLAATELNTQLRDNLLAIGTAAAYAPTWTNVTLGTTGLVNTASYSEAGKWITVRFLLTLGTGGAFTGPVNFTLPKPCATADFIGIGTALIIDGGSSATRRGVTVYQAGAQIAQMVLNDNAAGSQILTTALPWTWAATDSVAGTCTYLAA